MTEHEIQNDIRVALSKYGIVFRMNAGDFWQGKLCWSHEFSSRVLTDPTRVEGLPAGFSAPGHRAGVARSVEDAKEIIKNGI